MDSGRQWSEQGGLIQVDSQGSHGTLVSQAPIPCLAPLFLPQDDNQGLFAAYDRTKLIPRNSWHPSLLFSFNGFLKELIEVSMSLS